MRQILTTLLLTLSVLSSRAYDFEKDGFYYNITSASDKTVEITHGDSKYNLGEITLPSKVVYKNIEFAVTKIGDDAFHSSTFTGLTIPASIKEIGCRAFEYAGCNEPHYICFLSDVRIDSEAFWCSLYGTFIFMNHAVPTLIDTNNRGYLFNSDPICCISEGDDSKVYSEFAQRGSVTIVR